ncbi:hypothetical protein [Nocardiopsis potens]|uniref:hypothetical protein n=1 Tax=Nocardiopsis potens TaxID=1246458 RepID=UPI000346F043|nr:hypothetical protein [Nocardiopsis potens]
MKVRFAPWLSILFTLPGAALLVFGIWLWIQGSEGGMPTTLASLVLVGFGLAYRSMPYFALGGGRLTVPIMRGPKAETAIPARARVDASGDRLVMTVGKKKTDLPVRRSMAHPGDWAALQDLLARAQETEQP